MHCDDSHCLLPSSFRGIKTGKWGRKYKFHPICYKFKLLFLWKPVSSCWWALSVHFCRTLHYTFFPCPAPLQQNFQALFVLLFIFTALAWHWTWDTSCDPPSVLWTLLLFLLVPGLRKNSSRVISTKPSSYTKERHKKYNLKLLWSEGEFGPADLLGACV